jgi:hypothetical protein
MDDDIISVGQFSFMGWKLMLILVHFLVRTNVENHHENWTKGSHWRCEPFSKNHPSFHLASNLKIRPNLTFEKGPIFMVKKKKK